MTFQFPPSSTPSTPIKDDSQHKSTYRTNQSTTPSGSPPLSTGLSSPIEPPPFLGNSFSSSESLMKQNPFSSQNKENPSPSWTYTSKKDINIAKRMLPSEEISGLSRDEREERGHGEYWKGDVEVGEEYDFYPESGSNANEDSRSDLKPNSSEISEDKSDSEMEGIEEDNNRQDYSAAGASTYQNIARSIYSSMPIHSVEESDDIILATEAITLKLYELDPATETDSQAPEGVLSNISDELVRLWEAYYKQIIVYQSEEYCTTIGPGPHAPKFVKANFLASLALRMHHPHKSYYLRNFSSSFTSREINLPQILLEWMDEYHNPYPNQLEEIAAHRPSPANHSLFWDTIFNCLIRGKIMAVIKIMRNAGWKHSRDVTGDVRGDIMHDRLSSVTLTNIEWAMESAIDILLKCPATSGDWDSRRSQWRMFRLQALQALEDLKSFNEGRAQELDEGKLMLEPGSFNETARKAKSLIPWHLYQNLVTLYNLVMGDMKTILANSQDWCEATIGLVVWWDESKRDQVLHLGQYQQPPRLSTKSSIFKSFEYKLRMSFEASTSDSSDFQINSLDDFQVALASLFLADFESVVSFLCCWSGPVSCAVAEVASLAGWLPRAEEKSLINMSGSLDQDDFDLLGIAKSPIKSDGVKDRTLITYANNLSKRKELKSSVDSEKKLGSWELSIAILGRLDSADRSTEIIKELLDNFTLGDSSTVNKLWILLNSIGLISLAENAAQKYADDLAENSHKYGEALYYYSLAHLPNKVRNVLDLLISSTLVLSSAFPPDKDLDDHLKSLLTTPQSALKEISMMDLEAAKLLHTSFSGYATLRKFYELRDGHLLSLTGKPKMGAKARKVQASIALVAVITSSSDHIRGGLYDRENNAVVHVDFLLALLGEAMAFINQADFTFTVTQIETILCAIEDLHSIPSRVFAICSDFLQTVIQSSRAFKESSPMELNVKNDYCLEGSSVLASQLKQLTSPSEALTKNMVERGWDWRDKIPPGMTGDDLLGFLRIGLAKDLAKAWMKEIDHQL